MRILYKLLCFQLPPFIGYSSLLAYIIYSVFVCFPRHMTNVIVRRPLCTLQFVFPLNLIAQPLGSQCLSSIILYGFTFCMHAPKQRRPHSLLLLLDLLPPNPYVHPHNTSLRSYVGVGYESLRSLDCVIVVSNTPTL